MVDKRTLDQKEADKQIKILKTEISQMSDLAVATKVYNLKKEVEILTKGLEFYAKNEPKLHVIDRPENFGELYFESYEDEDFEIPFGTTARNLLEKESE